jgi:hypothetical protein
LRPSDIYCLKADSANYNAWHFRIHKYILWTIVRGQSVKHGGMYPLQDFKCLTKGIGKLKSKTIHGDDNAPRTLT